MSSWLFSAGRIYYMPSAATLSLYFFMIGWSANGILRVISFVCARQRRGAQSCLECQGGRLCNHTGLSQPPLCPTGHYCPLRSTVAHPCPSVSTFMFSCGVKLWMCHCRVSVFAARFTSSLCLHDFEFPPINPTLLKWFHVIIIQGSYSDQPGGDAVQHCRPCDAGLFCSRSGLSEPQGLCDPGHYCTSGSSTASPVRFNE